MSDKKQAAPAATRVKEARTYIVQRASANANEGTDYADTACVGPTYADAVADIVALVAAGTEPEGRFRVIRTGPEFAVATKVITRAVIGA